MRRIARRSTERWTRGVLFAVLAACVVWPLRATGDPVEAGSKPPVMYRRVFVPAGTMAVWPLEGQSFLPVEAREFEAWVAAANRSSAPAAPAATITEAVYSARLENGQLVDSRGEWTIACHVDEPVLLALGPMSLAVGDAHWKDDAAAPVRLGTWGRSGELPAEVGLEVARAGVLSFQWRAPTRAAGSDIELIWQLPPSATTRLVLDLPVGKRPIWEGGLIQRSPELAVGDASAAAKSVSQRWEMIAGSEAQPVLRIVDAKAGATVAAPASTLFVREELRYDISPRGLDIEAQLQLEGSSSTSRQLSIPLPSGVQLVSAAVDGREVSWKLVSERRGAPARALLELPVFADGMAQTVILRAWQVPTTNAPWPLPKLRLDDVFWVAGTIQLSCSPQLELQSLEANDCIQTGSHLAMEDGNSPEAISLTEYSPEADVEIVIGQRAPVAEAHVGTTLIVGNADVTGRSVARFEVERGALHTLTGELPIGWNVDAVETTPSDALSEWYVDEREGKRRIHVQLAEAIRVGQPIMLTLTGRLQPSILSAPLAVETLRMVHWQNTELVRNLLTVQTAEPYVVESVGELPEIAAANLTEADRSLLPATAESPIYDMRGVADSVAVRLATKKGSYAAEIWLDANFADDELRQTYHIVSRQQGGRVDQILVYTSAKFPGEIRWTEKSSGKPITAERVPQDDARLAGLPVEGELWHVHLPRPRAGSVAIDVSFTTPWSSRGSIPLLSLPEATDQRGRVLLSLGTERAPQLEARGMRAIPLPTDSTSVSAREGGLRSWAAYRYEPAQCQDATLRPQLWLEPSSSDTGSSSVIARRMELESHYAASGETVHRVTYHLENDRAASLQLSLPEGARLTSAHLNGQKLDLQVADENVQKFSVPLPKSRAATVSLSFTAKQPRLMPGSRLLPPVIGSELPILAGEWTIWMPSEFVALGAEVGETDDGLNWRQRLFGPLGRPTAARPFDFLGGSAWSSLVTGWADESPVVDDMQVETPAGPIDTDAHAASDAEVGLKRDKPSRGVTVAANGPPGAERIGWQSYRRTFIAGMPPPIVIGRPAMTTAWSVAVFLLFLVGGSLVRRRHVWFIGLTAALAMLCLVMPAVHAPLATGAFLGMLGSLFFVWPRRADPADPADAPTRTWDRPAMTGAIATALVFVLVNLVAAQETADVDPTPTAEPANIERVLIPVDAERRPAGSKVYISQQFFRQLIRQTEGTSKNSGQWLLTDATYRGELRHGPNGEEAVVGEWSMAFDIEVLGRDTTIRLPLVRNEADWPATVELDGVPLPFAWDADGRSCIVEVAEPGSYELTVSLVPRVGDVAGWNQIALTVPPKCGAKFELRRPTSMNGMEVTGASWQPNGDRAAGTMRGELDHSGQWVVRWPREKVPTGLKDVRLTELRWLRVGKAGVDMEVKYVVQRGAQLPQTLTIVTDRMWELVNDENRASDRVAELADGRHTVQVALHAEEFEQGEARLSWRLTDPPALGRLRLPFMELAATQASSWLAISSDPSLECEVANVAGLPAETVEEFLTLWGSAESREQPQIALGGVAPSRAITVGVRPRLAESSIDEVLHVAAGADVVRVQYQADVVPGRSHRFQFPLTIPDAMTIDKVGVASARRPIDVRWSRASADNVCIFFGEDLAEPYRLTLTGHVRVGESGGCVLPQVASMSLKAVIKRVQVYRDESVLVEVQGPANADDAAADLPPVGWNARLVAAYQLDSSLSDQVRLAITPNIVDTAGETLTTLSFDETLWWTTFTARLVVRQGELDTLRLRVPANWVGPLDVQPAGTIATVSPANGGQSIMSVRLAESLGIGETLTLEIRGPLAPASEAPVSVPEITSETPAEWHSYFSVPTTVHSQHVDWIVEGASAAEPPIELRPSRATETAMKTFGVVQRPYRSVLAPPRAEQPAASVRLADAVVVRGPSGNQLVATRFVIVPHGLTECELEIPQQGALISASLDGKPARVQKVESNRWKVALGSPQLPQILDVVSSPPLEIRQPLSRTFVLHRPTLHAGEAQIPEEMSLWSFGQSQLKGQPHVEGAALVSAADQAGLRLDRLTSIAEAATPAAAGLPIPDGYDWFRAWVELLTEAQDAAGDTISASAREVAASRVKNSVGDQLAGASNRIANWIERGYDVLGWPDMGPPLDAPVVAVPVRHWPPNVDGIGGWIFCVADGSADELTVELSRADADSRSARFLGVLAIAGLAGAAVWLARQPVARDLLYRWPHAIAVLAGVCWWAWLWPSWIGLFLAAASLLLMYRPGWPGRSLRAEGSTVLRTVRPR